MQQHLCVPFDALVELLVRGRRLLESNLMGHDERRLGSARDDQISEVSVIGFDVALAGTERQALLKELAEAEQDLALAGLLIWCAWIGRDVEAWNPDYRREHGQQHPQR